MSREKGVPEHVADYVQQRLAFETARRRGVAAEIARQTGATTAHIATVRLGRSPAGAGFVAQIAGYWGMGVDELYEAARQRVPGPWTEEEHERHAAAARERARRAARPAPASQGAPERWVEYNTRYPNLNLALRYARAEGRIDPAFIDEVAKTRLNSSDDLPLPIWLRLIELEADSRRRADQEWTDQQRRGGHPDAELSEDARTAEGRYTAARRDAGLSPPPSPEPLDPTDR